MIIQAELKRKQSEYKGEACAVDKVIELPAQRFRQFSRALLVDHDFIAENKSAIRNGKQMTISAFSDELAQVRTKKKEFLTQIERIVLWKEWLALIQPCYYKGERGNKPYPLETMLRLYLLQNLYDLSDEATVAETIDSRAFSDFCGVDSSNQVLDGDTLGRFRNLLLKNGLQEKLFAQVVAMLMERGLILKKGTIVDSPSFPLLLPLRIRKRSGIRMPIR